MAENANSDKQTATMTLPERRPSRARDTNQLAKRMVDVATGLESDIPIEPKSEQISAPARATSLMPERRREVGRKAAAAR